jgi:hypothetical protein
MPMGYEGAMPETAKLTGKGNSQVLIFTKEMMVPSRLRKANSCAI